MLDMLLRVGEKEKYHFFFFNTGLEYAATREHLKFLEKKYGICIETIRPIKNVVTSVRQYGTPFFSKDISLKIESLQRYGFEFKDEPYEVLCLKYPKIKDTIKWWCNEKPGDRFNIKHLSYMKEFLIDNPPEFPISSKCCQYTKKGPAHKLYKERKFDAVCVGVRKAEGGVRATSYKSCFNNEGSYDNFRPVFWLSDTDKDEYCSYYGVTHSKCYTEYGMKRTGCCGCPLNKCISDDLGIIHTYEPNLYKASVNVFGKGYEYTKRFNDYRTMMKERDKHGKKED